MVALHSSHDATVNWGNAMQNAILNATSLAAGAKTLFYDLGQSGAALAEAEQKVTAAQEHHNTAMSGGSRSGFQLNQAYTQQAAKATELAGINQQLTQQQQTYTTRLDLLAKKYGGVANAQGLLITAGITMKQMLDKSGAAWAMIQQQVEGAYRGYAAMANQTGVLGNAMQVLDKQQTDQYKSMQKLNQGWDAQISAMTATQTAFDTVAQGMETLSTHAGDPETVPREAEDRRTPTVPRRSTS